MRGFPTGSAVKNTPANAEDAGDTGLIPTWEDLLEKEMATHSSILARRIPGTEQPGGLQSLESQRVRHAQALTPHQWLSLCAPTAVEHNQNQNQTNKKYRAWVGSVLSKFKGSFCRNPRRHTVALRSPSLFQGPEVAELCLSIQKGSEMKVTHSCLTLCDPMDYTVHEIPQARILEWVVIPFSRGSCQPKSNPDLMHCRWILYQLSHKKEILMVPPMFPLHANSLSTLCLPAQTQMESFNMTSHPKH